MPASPIILLGVSEAAGVVVALCVWVILVVIFARNGFTSDNMVLNILFFGLLGALIIKSVQDDPGSQAQPIRKRKSHLEQMAQRAKSLPR